MIEYDATHDVLYVNISLEGSVSRSETIAGNRGLDYAEDGSLIAVHFLQASLGIELDDIPEKQRVKEALLSLRKLLLPISP